MNFGDKVKKLRKERRLSQQELARSIGVSVRTLQNYEAGLSYPKKRSVYQSLAEALDCDQNFLLTEDEEFITEAAAVYGGRAARQAQAIIEQTAAMFAGGELSDEDQIAFLNEIQALYLDSKKRAKRFTPGRYQNPDTDEL